MLARISDRYQSAAPSPADARAKLRDALEATLPAEMIEAERRVGDARDARAEVARELSALQAKLDGDSGNSRSPTNAEVMLVNKLAALDAKLKEECASLMQSRETFSDALPALVGAQLRNAAPGLMQTIRAINEALPLLVESDQFACKHGLRPVGVSCIAYEVARLQSLAGILRAK